MTADHRRDPRRCAAATIGICGATSRSKRSKSCRPSSTSAAPGPLARDRRCRRQEEPGEQARPDVGTVVGEPRPQPPADVPRPPPAASPAAGRPRRAAGSRASTALTCAPSASSSAIAASAATATRGSIGTPSSRWLDDTDPQALDAVAQPSVSGGTGVVAVAGSEGRGRRSPRAGAHSPPHVRASGPTVSNVHETGTTPRFDTRPVVGRTPVTPQKHAGIRIEPAVSVPSVPATRPAAAAAPLPPLEPPQIRSVSHGLRAGPKCGLVVVAPKANSCVLSFPTTIAPAARRRATTTASAVAMLSARIFDAAVVRRPGDVDHVLDRHRDPVQPASSLAPLERGGLGQRLLARTERKAFSARVAALDALQARRHGLARRQLAGPEPPGKAREAHVGSSSGLKVLRACVRRRRLLDLARAGRIVARNPARAIRSSSVAATPCELAAARSSSSDGRGLDSIAMPIYEYRCEACGEKFEEFLSSSDEACPALPELWLGQGQAPALADQHRVAAQRCRLGPRRPQLGLTHRGPAVVAGCRELMCIACWRFVARARGIRQTFAVLVKRPREA